MENVLVEQSADLLEDARGHPHSLIFYDQDKMWQV